MQPRRALRAGLLAVVAAAPFLITLAVSKPSVPAGRNAAADVVPALPEGGDELDLFEDRSPLPVFGKVIADRRPALAALLALLVARAGAAFTLAV